MFSVEGNIVRDDTGLIEPFNLVHAPVTGGDVPSSWSGLNREARRFGAAVGVSTPERHLRELVEFLRSVA